VRTASSAEQAGWTLRTLLRRSYIQQYGVTPPVRGETGIECG
jgi:hypothetical protein